MTHADPPCGEVDIARIAALFADRTRARILVALADGRSLPAGVLAAEAGVSAQAASAQLARLRDGDLVTVEQSGRHRYYRLASGQVATILEGLATMAPVEPITSLRQGTRAAALRNARICYDHLAGRLGCAVTQALLDRHALESTDGLSTTARRPGNPLSAALPEHPYRLGPAAPDVLGTLGVDIRAVCAISARRLVLRFCLDWSEQRHHLGGRLGAVLLDALEHEAWIERRPRDRAVRVTEVGRQEFRRRLGFDVSRETRSDQRRATARSTRPA